MVYLPIRAAAQGEPRERFNARPRNAGGAADETPKFAAENAGSQLDHRR